EVRDEKNAGAHEAGEQVERAPRALVRVSDLDPLLANEPGQPPGRPQIPLALHRDADVREPGGVALRGRRVVRGRGDDDVVPPRGQATRQLQELDRRAREEIPLWIDLKDAKRSN